MAAIHAALKQLFLLSALNPDDGSLLPLGTELARFPLEPSFGVSLIAAHYLGCAHEAGALVSVMSSEQVWLAHSRRDNASAAEEQLVDIRRRFAKGTDMRSDHMLIVQLFNEWIKNHRNEQWCWKNRL